MGHGRDPRGLCQPSAVCRNVSPVFTSLRDCLSRVSRLRLSLCPTLQEWGRGHEEDVQVGGFPTSDQAVQGRGTPSRGTGLRGIWVRCQGRAVHQVVCVDGGWAKGRVAGPGRAALGCLMTVCRAVRRRDLDLRWCLELVFKTETECFPSCFKYLRT